MVPVKWNGKPINVMMDTGADHSVVDRGTVQKMNVPYSTKYSQVYRLGRTALAICGTPCVAIDVGDGRPLEHEIEVLDTNNRAILGSYIGAKVPRALQEYYFRLGKHES